MAIYESEKMERHIVRLLQNEGLLGKVLLMKPYPALQQVIEAAGGICAADDGETQPDVIVFCMGLSEKTAQVLKKKAEQFRCPILLAEGNAGWVPLALAALSGGERFHALYEMCGCPSFTEKSMDECLSAVGFKLYAKDDIMGQVLEENVLENAFEAPGAQLHKTLCGITETTVPSAQTMQFVRLYRWTETSEQKTENVENSSPFLTVVMRTQGTRAQSLREAFLCLTAQEDMDFEVILIGHKVPQENRKKLQQILDELPPVMQERLRYYPLDTGGRAEPINFGFEKARGQYVAVFDDDDILTADWVSSFKRIYKRAPGAILHTYAVGQDWKFVTPRGKAGLRAISAFDKRFCTDFSWKKQLHTNYCPLMSLAFPTYVYKKMGQRFDISLEVTEDWDFLLRTASFCGVENEASVTAVYRLWKNASNSYTKHGADYWRARYQKITERNQQLMILLPQGGSEVLRKGHQAYLDKKYLLELIQKKDADTAVLQEQLPVMDEKLYCDDGNGWSEENSFVQECVSRVGKFSFLYKGIAKVQKNAGLRWDPASYGGLIIQNLKASVTDASGQKYIFRPEDICANGQAYENGYLFLEDDPQVYFQMPDGFVPELFMITGQAKTAVSVKKMYELFHLDQYIRTSPGKAAIKLLLGKHPTRDSVRRAIRGENTNRE